MNVNPNDPGVLRAIAEGRVFEGNRPLQSLEPAPEPAAEKPEKKAKRVESSILFKITMVLAVECPSTANTRDWKVRDKAARAQRSAVRQFFQKHPAILVSLVAYPKSVKFTVTRLGGRELDKRDNLRVALKPVIDELHAWFGIDDKTDTLDIAYLQIPGGAVGIQIDMELRS